LAVFLWNNWFDNLWEMLMTKPLNGAYIVLGMFLLGFVPVLFYVGETVVSPAIIVAVFLLLSGLGSWLAGPVRAPSAVPTPFALYILLWVGVVALASLLGGLEYRRKQRVTG
jgi:predicted membrane-bound spermidine synthase